MTTFSRRHFMRGAGALGLGLLAPFRRARAAGKAAPAAEAGPITESRVAYRELLEVLEAIDTTYLSPVHRISSPGDVADGHRLAMHLLEGGVDLYFEADPDYPVFKRIVSPTRKRNGDNPDAVYFAAPLRGGQTYRVRGNLADATYTSFTVEAGKGEGQYASRTAGVLNDSQIDVSPEGDYEIVLSPEAEGRNALRLDPEATRLTTRHYFERPNSAAGDPRLEIPLAIDNLGTSGPPPDWDDARIAAGIRRVANDIRGRSVDAPDFDPSAMPSWVSLVPNRFNTPEPPGDLAFAAIDAAYAMAPYALAPDEALVMEGRFPACRFANVVLWNRYLQTYDYMHRQVSLNRTQTELEDDGRYRIVLAARDPGVPNWLDTQGRPSGSVYWRFILPEGEVDRPATKVVKIDALNPNA